MNLLCSKLRKIYENPTGQDHKSKKYQDAKLSSGFEDVFEKTAKVTGVNEKTVQRVKRTSTIRTITFELYPLDKFK